MNGVLNLLGKREQSFCINSSKHFSKGILERASDGPQQLHQTADPFLVFVLGSEQSINQNIPAAPAFLIPHILGPFPFFVADQLVEVLNFLLIGFDLLLSLGQFFLGLFGLLGILKLRIIQLELLQFAVNFLDPFLFFFGTDAAPGPDLQNIVPGFSTLGQNRIQFFVNCSPQGRSLLHIAENQLKGSGPAALGGFLQGVHHLGEGTNLRSGFQGFLAKLHKILLGRFVMNTPGFQCIFVNNTTVNLKGTEHGFLVQPAFAQVFAEIGSRKLDSFLQLLPVFILGQHVGDHTGTVSLLLYPPLQRGHFQEGFLQLLGRNIRVLQALPVNRRHLAHADGLADVIHRHTGLLGALTRVCGSVGNTLHGRDRALQFHAVVGKLAQVAGHVRQAVDGLVRILGHILKVHRDRVNALAGGAHDGLHGIHRAFILIPSGGNRLNC